jgi:transposase
MKTPLVECYALQKNFLRPHKPSANTTVAHKLVRRVYFMMTCGEAFVDQRQQRYEAQQLQRRVAALKRWAKDLGFVISLGPTTV